MLCQTGPSFKKYSTLIDAVLCLTKSKLLCDFKFQTRMLSLVGGHNLQSVIANILKQLLTHQLSKAFNMTGAKGKTSFRQHKTLLRVVYRELFSHTRHIGVFNQRLLKRVSCLI